jgi:hypothetical protein
VKLPEPFCEFCRHNDGSFDYEEHHAILCGIGDGLQPWRSDTRAWGLFSKDWWYYIVARGVTTFIGLVALVVAGGLAWN